jgi:hypothetical protein
MDSTRFREIENIGKDDIRKDDINPNIQSFEECHKKYIDLDEQQGNIKKLTKTFRNSYMEEYTFQQTWDSVTSSLWKSVKGFAYGEILGMNTQMHAIVENNRSLHRSYHKEEYTQLYSENIFTLANVQENHLPNPMFGARINSIIYKSFTDVIENNQVTWEIYFNNFVSTVREKIKSVVSSSNEFELFMKCCPNTTWLLGHDYQSTYIYYNTMQYMFPLATLLSQAALVSYHNDLVDYFGNQTAGKPFGLPLFIIAFVHGEKLSRKIFPTDDYSDVSVVAGFFCGILAFLPFPNYSSDFGKYHGVHDPVFAINNLKNIIYRFYEVVNNTTLSGEAKSIFSKCFDDINNSLYTNSDENINALGVNLNSICFGDGGYKHVEYGSLCRDSLHKIFQILLIVINYLTININESPDELLKKLQMYFFERDEVSAFLLSIIGGLIGLIIKENDFTLLDEQYEYLNKDYKFNLDQFKNDSLSMLILLDKTMTSTSEEKDVTSMSIEEEKEEKDDTSMSIEEEKEEKDTNVIISKLDNVFNVLLGFNAGLVYGDFSKNGLGNMIWRFTQKKNLINESLSNDQEWLNILDDVYTRNQWDTPENYKLFGFFTPVCVPYLSYWPIANVSKNEKRKDLDNVIISFFFLRQPSNEIELSIGDVSALLYDTFYFHNNEYFYGNALKFGDMPCIHFKLNILRYLQEFWVKRSKFYNDPTIFVCGLKTIGGDSMEYKYDKFLQEAKSLCKTNQKNCEFGFFNYLEQNIGQIQSKYDSNELMEIFDIIGRMSDHKMSTISEIHYIIPSFNYFMILEYLIALKHDDPKRYLDSVIEDPFNNSKSCFPDVIDIMYDITIQHKIMDLYALFVYILRKFVHDGLSLDVDEYINIAHKTSTFRSGLVAEENESRTQKMLDYSELVDNIDGDYEMYILGCFIHDLKDNYYKTINEHDVFMKYLVEYSGIRRGILGPLLGAIYGLFVTCKSRDPTSVFEKMGGDRYSAYNKILEHTMGDRFSQRNLDVERGILQSLTETIFTYNFN